MIAQRALEEWTNQWTSMELKRHSREMKIIGFAQIILGKVSVSICH